MTVDPGSSSIEFSTQRVDRDNRILLPHAFLKRTGWPIGTDPMRGWILLNGPGRCRLLPAALLGADAGFQQLRSKIAEQKDQDAIDFEDDGLATLGLRLLPLELMPPGPGWRLTLPKVIATLMEIHRKESSVALLARKHVEIWTLEALRFAMTTPIADLI